MKLTFDFLSDRDVDSLSSFLLNETWDLHDPRFGAPGKKCESCREKCSGHFACLELGECIFHPYFTKEIKEALSSSCEMCGGEVVRDGKQNRCTSCRRIVKTEFSINHRQLYQAKGPEGNLSPRRVRTILKNKEEKKYIISKVLVPPVGIRPPEDVEWPSDLARAYLSLVDAVRGRKGINPIANAFNKIAGIGRSESVMKLLSGKEGIFRSIMLGKRLDRCARSVITGDPNVDIDRILVPKIIAEKIKIPETVNSYNIDVMMKRAAEGKVWCEDREAQAGPEDMAHGVSFDRCLEDGDKVLFNRQPSLSRFSLMSFTVEVRPQDDILTIGFNPCVTGPYNADFDGDEMNLFAGFGAMSKAEMDILCDVKENISVIKAIQDTVTGAYLMCEGKHRVTREILFDCMCISERYVPDLIPTGKNLFSLSLPEQLNYEDENITVKNGILEKGTVDGRVLNGTLMKAIHDRFGKNAAMRYLQNIQKIVIRWMSDVGFGVHLRDLLWSEEDISLTGGDMELAYKVCEERYSGTSVMSMIRSGAKGNVINAVQMSVSLGNQHVLGEDRGFVRSSYLKGLSPDEFMLHATAAREGVINTGVSTAITGYLNRRGCKIVAGIRQRYNGTIGAEGKTIRF
jgi:DNA-directed RNA polymerase beta' subunit